MATKKKTKKQTGPTRESIMASYMEHVLEQEHPPKSVYKFCKEQKIAEDEFYRLFGSFKGLRSEIWNAFFDQTLSLIQKQNAYDGYENKDKLLTFYFTFFELLTANRSYILLALDPHQDWMQNITQLSGLRSRIKEYAAGLIENANEQKQIKVLKQPVSVFSEGTWLQTLFILKYWMEDSSPAFEKTDLVIEKSVRAIFDLFDTKPLESLLDFGKFLWKDKMN